MFWARQLPLVGVLALVATFALITILFRRCMLEDNAVVTLEKQMPQSKSEDAGSTDDSVGSVEVDFATSGLQPCEATMAPAMSDDPCALFH